MPAQRQAAQPACERRIADTPHHVLPKQLFRRQQRNQLPPAIAPKNRRDLRFTAAACGQHGGCRIDRSSPRPAPVPAPGRRPAQPRRRSPTVTNTFSRPVHAPWPAETPAGRAATTAATSCRARQSRPEAPPRRAARLVIVFRQRNDLAHGIKRQRVILVRRPRMRSTDRCSRRRGRGSVAVRRGAAMARASRPRPGRVAERDSQHGGQIENFGDRLRRT